MSINPQGEVLEEMAMYAAAAWRGPRYDPRKVWDAIGEEERERWRRTAYAAARAPKFTYAQEPR